MSDSETMSLVMNSDHTSTKTIVNNNNIVTDHLLLDRCTTSTSSITNTAADFNDNTVQQQNNYSGTLQLNDNCSSSIDDNRTVYLSIDEAIDAIGYGKCQYGILVATGLAFMADAMEVMLLSFLQVQVPFVIDNDSSNSNSSGSFLTSIVFIGSFIGSIIFGPLSDYYGRRTIFLLSTGCILCIFSICTTFCTTYNTLVLCRFMVGIGIGTLTIPNDIWIEFLPSNKRGTNMLYTGYFWTIGTVAVPAIAYLIHIVSIYRNDETINTTNNNDWRILVFICSIPCIVSTIVGYMYIPESPRWLLSRHYTMYPTDQFTPTDSYYHKEALRILRHAATMNGNITASINTLQVGDQYQQLTAVADDDVHLLDDNSNDNNSTTNHNTSHNNHNSNDSLRLILFNPNAHLVIDKNIISNDSNIIPHYTDDDVDQANMSSHNNNRIHSDQATTGTATATATAILRRNSNAASRTDTATSTITRVVPTTTRSTSSNSNSNTDSLFTINDTAHSLFITATTSLYHECVRSVSFLFSKEFSQIYTNIICLWILYPILYYGTILVTTTVIFYNSSPKNDNNTTNTATTTSVTISSSFNYSAIFMTSVAEIFGLSILFYTIDNVGRKRCQEVSYVLGGISMFILCWYDSHYKSSSASLSSMSSFILILWAFVGRMCYKVAVCTTWITTSELLPTSIRGTGHGVANSVARLSAAASPYIVQSSSSTSSSSSVQTVGILLLIVSIVTSIVVRQLPESKGRRLH